MAEKKRAGKLKRLFSWKAKLLLILFPILSLLLIIVIAAGMIAAVIGGGASGSKHNQSDVLTEQYDIDDQQKQITYIFKSYSEYSVDPLRKEYANKYNTIVENDYEPALIAIWTDLINNSYIENHAKRAFSGEEGTNTWTDFYKSLKQDKKDFFLNSDLKRDKQGRVITKKYKEKKLDAYRYTSQNDYINDRAFLRYYTFLKNKFSVLTADTANYLNKDAYKEENYVVDVLKDKDKGNAEDKYYSVVYSDNIIRMMLDAFTDAKTGKVFKSAKEYLPEYKKAHPEKFKNLKGKKNREKRIEICRNYLFRRILHRFEGEGGLLESCVITTLAHKTEKASTVETTKKAKKSTTTYKNYKYKYITDWIYTKTDSEKKFNYAISDHKFTKAYYNQLLNNILSIYDVGNSADGICSMAKAQIGKTGDNFWNDTKCWDGGANHWCAIFCGWLIEHSGMSPHNVGWDAYCPSWVSNAREKGIFKDRGSYTPKPGDFVLFQYARSSSADHVGIVVGSTPKTFTTVEGNTGGTTYYDSVVSSNTYNLDNTDILGFVNVRYKGALSSSGTQKGKKLYPSVVDPVYTGHTVALTPSERRSMEALVYNENGGNGYEGCLLLAQCLRDAIYFKYNGATPSNVHDVMGYEASAAEGFSSEAAKQAVRDIFDKGDYAVKHRLLFMYAPQLCNSEWHESQLFIIEHDNGGGPVRFFDALT